VFVRPAAIPVISSITTPVKSILITLSLGAALASTAMGAATFINGGFGDNASAYVVWPGYSNAAGSQNIATNPAAPTGWTVSASGTGINSDAVIATDSIAGVVGIGGANNPFIDNGAETDGVLLLQGVASASQNVTGFTVGESYILTFDVNARNCCGDVPQGQLSIGGSIVIPFTSVTPVGGTNLYNTITVPFTAPAASLDFLIESRASAGGDATLLVDNFALAVVPEPSTLAVLALSLGLVVRRRR
jgi:hypothetical protein